MNKEMSGLEKEEIATRVKAMTKSEIKLVAKMIPTNILWDELRRRDEVKTQKLQTISKAMGMED